MSLSLFDLTGRVAVITGSSRGIGRAMAEIFAEAGGKVVISGRNLEPCEEVVAAIKAKGGEATAIPCRISDKAQCENLIAKSIEAYGKVDILVCNAAINPHHGPIDGLSDEAFERMMTNNVQSNFWLSKLVKPGMAERKNGSIIYIISVAALHASLELPMYGITKLADYALARNLAAAWGPNGIRVNCIAPGLVVTQFARVLYEDPARRAAREAATPLGRLGQPVDIAGPALLLASPAGAFITGQIITVDGGTTIQAR
jgi:NAD(P)-dependent dehydrogenase (short-subunit alcohol dehydrogenase family)